MECDRTLGLRRKGQALERRRKRFDYGALETYCDPIDGRGNGTKFEKNSKNARDNNKLTIIFLLFFLDSSHFYSIYCIAIRHVAISR